MRRLSVRERSLGIPVEIDQLTVAQRLDADLWDRFGLLGSDLAASLATDRLTRAAAVAATGDQH
ncbi:MAG: hypothetical protein ACXWC0_27360 [Burkholderiales bacterium]